MGKVRLTIQVDIPGYLVEGNPIAFSKDVVEERLAGKFPIGSKVTVLSESFVDSSGKEHVKGNFAREE